MEFPCRAFLRACGGRYAPPTCVGNTMCFLWTRSPQPVHPHMRGEYAGEYLEGLDYLRFIPTCVGNTPGLNVIQISEPVHPHVRGEYMASRSSATMYAGSSPRAWGIPKNPRANNTARRFIPTCVGNTVWRRSYVREISVHPHVRGEYTTRRTTCWSLIGSSPRAWGIRSAAGDAGSGVRFIPTCVGNTPCRRRPRGWWPVHPHVRGEYTGQACIETGRSGSSPRAWGILFQKT